MITNKTAEFKQKLFHKHLQGKNFSTFKNMGRYSYKKYKPKKQKQHDNTWWFDAPIIAGITIMCIAIKTNMTAAIMETITGIALMISGICGTIAIYRHAKENEKYINAMKAAIYAFAVFIVLSIIKCGME
jgi:uncharacterized membrane protein HdeD (DUF308 family)